MQNSEIENIYGLVLHDITSRDSIQIIDLKVKQPGIKLETKNSNVFFLNNCFDFGGNQLIFNYDANFTYKLIEKILYMKIYMNMEAYCKLYLMNIEGNVKALHEDYFYEGTYDLNFDLREMSRGAYFIILEYPKNIVVKKMML